VFAGRMLAGFLHPLLGLRFGSDRQCSQSIALGQQVS
jgi:hypothetical protein